MIKFDTPTELRVRFIIPINMASDFTSIPTIDLALAKSLETETLFFSELRRALVQVGFFYLKNHSIPQSVKQEAVQHANAFFDLPLEKKLAIETARSKHFLGYNRMDSETTAATTDHNESLAVNMSPQNEQKKRHSFKRSSHFGLSSLVRTSPRLVHNSLCISMCMGQARYGIKYAIELFLSDDSFDLVAR